MTRYEQLGALGMVGVAMAVIAWKALMGSDQSEGAIISVVSAGVGFYLRGRVERPAS